MQSEVVATLSRTEVNVSSVIWIKLLAANNIQKWNSNNTYRTLSENNDRKNVTKNKMSVDDKSLMSRGFRTDIETWKLATRWDNMHPRFTALRSCFSTLTSTVSSSPLSCLKTSQKTNCVVVLFCRFCSHNRQTNKKRAGRRRGRGKGFLFIALLGLHQSSKLNGLKFL